MTLTELAQLLQDKTDNSEPTYLEIKTPVKDEGRWYGTIIWMHHDGDIPEVVVRATTLPELEAALTIEVHKYIDIPL